MPKYSKKKVAGISWFVLHCLLFSIISIVSKKLVDNLHISQILFFQTLICTIVLLPVVIFLNNGKIQITSYKIHLYRALFWCAASALFFYSLTMVNTSKAIATSFTVPLFTTIMAVIFLKEKLHKRRTISLIIGFIGMLIIIQPGFDSFEPASILIVIASLLWSMTDIMIKLLSKTQHAFTNTLLFALPCIFFTAPFAAYYWKTPTFYEFSLLLLLGILFLINIYSVTKAYENTKLTIMMPFSFSQLIFVAVLSYIVFGEVITTSTLIGSIIIVGSTSYIAIRERKKHKKFLAPEIAEEIYEVDVLKK